MTKLLTMLARPRTRLVKAKARSLTIIEDFSEGLQLRQLFPNSIIIDKNVMSMTRKASNPSE